jgi:isocitrate/isopropylmalate dehydrogenase
LQAIVHTENPLRMVFELDDQFDSYSDAGTLASMQYEMRLSDEMGTRPEVERIAVRGFELARERGGKLTSVDKVNVMHTSRLWRDVVTEMAGQGIDTVRAVGSYTLTDNVENLSLDPERNATAEQMNAPTRVRAKFGV